MATMHTSLAARQKGMSIVELMVAILIGLIILAGVIQVTFTSKATFLGQEDMAFVQENARYAVDTIGRDIQNAGHWGCAGGSPLLAFVARVDQDAYPLVGAQPVHGFDGSSDTMPDLIADDIRKIKDAVTTSTEYKPDALVVRAAEGEAIAVESDSSNNLALINQHNFRKGSFVAVIGEDCRRAGVLQAGDGTAGDEITYGGPENCSTAIKPAAQEAASCKVVPKLNEDGTPVTVNDENDEPQEVFTCNCTGASELQQAYLPGSTVMAYGAKIYFVGESSVLPGQPALKRRILENGGSREEELVLGVEDMEVLYGVDTSDDGSVNRYITATEVEAGDDWDKVNTVQVSLVFRSQTSSLPEAVAVELLDKNYNDRFMRQVVTSTFRLRNRT